MVFLDFIVGIVVIIVLFLAATQIVIPIMRGTQWFPVLRKEHNLVATLEAEQQHLAESSIVKQIAEVRIKAERLTRQPPAEKETEEGTK